MALSFSPTGPGFGAACSKAGDLIVVDADSKKITVENQGDPESLIPLIRVFRKAGFEKGKNGMGQLCFFVESEDFENMQAAFCAAVEILDSTFEANPAAPTWVKEFLARC